MRIAIKKVNIEAHAPLLLQLYNRIFVENYHTQISDIKTLLKNYKHCSALIAYEKKMPVGLLIYEDKGSFIQLWEFGLLPEYQHKGIGQHFMKAFLKDIKKELQLITNPRNSPAIIFYLKQGFEIFAWKEKFFNNQDWIVLRKTSKSVS